MNSLDTLLNRTAPRIRYFILELRDYILGLSENIEEKCTNKMITYHTIAVSKSSKGGRRTKGLCWFNLTNGSYLRIHLRKRGNYPDKYKRLVPIGWGDYPEITFKEYELDSESMDYLKFLISEANKVL